MEEGSGNGSGKGVTGLDPSPPSYKLSRGKATELLRRLKGGTMCDHLAKLAKEYGYWQWRRQRGLSQDEMEDLVTLSLAPWRRPPMGGGPPPRTLS